MYKNDDRQNMGKIKFDIEIETIGREQIRRWRK